MRRRPSPKQRAAAWAGSARVFRALGDETRLQLVVRLSNQGPESIAKLSAGFEMSRQAITKHLRVIERSGLVRSRRQGRESIWQLNPDRLQAVRRYLDMISKQWDGALARLREFVED